MYYVLCAIVFLTGYLLSIVTITVGFHRGLAHKAVKLHPALKAIVVHGGNWLTGLDPKAWVVMHRLHHEHSDTPLDPHSPNNVGILGIGMEQLRSYERVIIGLLKKDPAIAKYAKDLDFELNYLNRHRLWYVPYALHLTIGVALGFAVGPLLGAAYYFGMVSHPIQGGLVNSFGHWMGPRNFETRDNSRNNHVVAWLIFGEGFQNNHHRYPASATFSYRWYEIDMGYTTCQLMERAKLLEINRDALIPRPAAALSRSREELRRASEPEFVGESTG